MSQRRRDSGSAELPGKFIARQSALLGEEAGAFVAALREPAVRALRVNEHKVTLSQLARRVGIPVDPVPWCPTATYLPPQVRLGDTVEHRAGLFYLQEPSSMAVVETLDIEAQHRVLDVAAAPGGKSTHAASRLGPDGFLLANEVTAARLGPLMANLDAWGYQNTAIARVSVERLAQAMPRSFDRVIVDAPCSGEALFRRQPSLRSEWSEAQVSGAARRQAKLLASAARAVAPGGLLAYSTCTFAPAENEEQIAAFLADHRDWQVAHIRALEQARVVEVGDPAATAGRALRFYPHLCRCEGQFIAVLRAPGESVGDRRSTVSWRKAVRRGSSGSSSLSAWTAFADQSLRKQFNHAKVLLKNETFYLQPAAVDLPENIALRPGLLLGRIVGATFQPAHALALTLQPDEVTAHEELTGDEMRSFREGAPVLRPGPPGWVLATIERWPVGWARRREDRLVARLPGHARSRGSS